MINKGKETKYRLFNDLLYYYILVCVYLEQQINYFDAFPLLYLLQFQIVNNALSYVLSYPKINYPADAGG